MISTYIKLHPAKWEKEAKQKQQKESTNNSKVPWVWNMIKHFPKERHKAMLNLPVVHKN